MTITGARWKSLLLVLGGVVLGLTGAALASAEPGAALICLAAGGALLVLGAARLLKAPTLEVTAEGFTITAFPWPARSFRWRDLAGLGGSSRAIVVRYAEGAAPAGRLQAAIPTGLWSVPTTRLTEILGETFERAIGYSPTEEQMRVRAAG